MQQEVVNVILKLVIITSLAITTYCLLGLQGFIALNITAIATGLFMLRKYRHFRTKGFISHCSPKLRAIFLQRSLLDIFRDLVYFPYITKILGFFISVATSKPNPELVPQLIKELPKEVVDIASRKGLLSLTPSAVQQLVLPLQGREFLSVHYGHAEGQWDRIEEYHQVDAPPHEATLEKRIVHFLDSKMGWLTAFTLIGLTLTGSHHMKFRRFRKMMVQNATFCCLVLSVISIAVKIRRQSHQKNTKPPKRSAIQAPPQE